MALIAERDRFDIDERFLWKLHVVTYGAHNVLNNYLQKPHSCILHKR